MSSFVERMAESRQPEKSESVFYTPHALVHFIDESLHKAASYEPGESQAIGEHLYGAQKYLGCLNGMLTELGVLPADNILRSKADSLKISDALHEHIDIKRSPDQPPKICLTPDADSEKLAAHYFELESRLNEAIKAATDKNDYIPWAMGVARRGGDLAKESAAARSGR